MNSKCIYVNKNTSSTLILDATKQKNEVYFISVAHNFTTNHFVVLTVRQLKV